MKSVISALALAAALALAPAQALAAEDEPCMAPVEVTASFLSQLAAPPEGGFAGEGRIPPFLVGTIQATAGGDLHGSILFVLGQNGEWRAFAPRPNEYVQAIYVAPQTGGIFILTMWESEGPGDSWTLLVSDDGLASGECVAIAMPAGLNEPVYSNAYLEVLDLDMDEDGKAELIAIARNRADGAEPLYRYQGRRDGTRWGKPQQLKTEREARGGLYEPLPDGPAPGGLWLDLQRYADERD